MIWKYKIDLVSSSVFNDLEATRNIIIPEELRKLIIEANAASPEKKEILIGKRERVVGAILSFNKDEPDVDDIYTALSVVEDKEKLPFAIDPAGNCFCLDCESDEVVFYNHETQEYETSGLKLTSFIDSLK